jgi:hypothetical protein
MKINSIVAILTNAMLLFACNNNSETKPVPQAETSDAQINEQQTLCYVLQNEKDTVSLQMTVDKNHVSGDLLYHYFEKDRNSGTIEGEMKGDTIFAAYTFMSEGKESKRDVVFLKKGDKLMEGYADINPATGEPDFSDYSMIKFDEKFILKKIDCK